MRKIVGWVRIPEEPWADTMRRMTTKINDALLHSKMQMWSTRLAITQWKFVGRLKQLPLASWPSRAAYWKPEEIDDPSCDFVPHRERGRPFTRWDDNVSGFAWRHFGESWQDVPYARFWRELDTFVNEI